MKDDRAPKKWTPKRPRKPLSEAALKRIKAKPSLAKIARVEALRRRIMF